jgi:hypothetical protein
MYDDGKYKCTYTFQCEYENVDLPGEPRHCLTFQSFDGTDAHIQTVVNQFVTFLKAAGYSFYDLEVIKDANSYKV